MPIHISDFEINKFRGIESLRINSLSHINVLLGDNNSGKTSILECIGSLQEPASLWNWRNIFRTSYRSQSTLYDSMNGMFPVDMDDKEISYSFKNGEGEMTKVSVKGSIDFVQMPERELQRLNGFIPTGNQKNSKWDALIESKCLRLKFLINDELKNEYDLYDFLKRIGNDKVANEYYATLLCRPMDHLFEDNNLSIVLEDIELQKKMVEVLKIFDVSIEGIQAIQNKFGSEYRIVSAKHKKAIPLNMYGDGMKKAVGLISSLVAVHDGILLIDEFETSIHTSAMLSVYRWILQVAKALNVQIIMTTHSKEAVEVLLSLDEFRDDMAVYTLYDKDGKHTIRRMSGDEALYAMENWGMDLRK